MKRPFASAALAACATFVSPAALAGNYMITFDGIAGSIELVDFSFGVENPTTIGSATGGAGSGKAKFNEFTIKVNEHATSTLHFENVASGRHIPGARLTVMHPETGRPQSEWALTDVLVTSFGIVNGAPDPKAKQENTFLLPVTRVAFSFGRACYKVFAGDGSVRQNCWNVVTNAPT